MVRHIACASDRIVKNDRKSTRRTHCVREWFIIEYLFGSRVMYSLARNVITVDVSTARENLQFLINGNNVM